MSDSKIKVGDIVIHPNFAGHKNMQFTVTQYDVDVDQFVRNDGLPRAINLDFCKVIRQGIVINP